MWLQASDLISLGPFYPFYMSAHKALRAELLCGLKEMTLVKFLHTAGAEETISFLSPKGYAQGPSCFRGTCSVSISCWRASPPVLPLRVPTDGLGEGEGAQTRSSPKQWQNERARPVPFPGEERSWEAAGPPGQVASSWLAT